MKIKVEINNNEVTITKDSEIMNFNAEELEKIIEAGLENNLNFEGLEETEYETHKDNPYVELIYGIYNSLDKESDFMKKLAELEAEKTQAEEKLKELETENDDSEEISPMW